MKAVPSIRRAIRSGATIALLAALPSAALSQSTTAPASVETFAPPPPFAFFADLTLAAPLVVDAVVRSAARIKGIEAVGVSPGSVRFYVTADVSALIRSRSELPARIGYLVDLPATPDGRAPKLKGARLLLFARPAPGSGDQLQLLSPDAQQPWSAAADALVRRVARAAAAADAPPMVTGVGSAFHVAGSLPGEGETQMFLRTADNRPVSLSILRRPGEQPRWAVALGEIVDEAAAPPARDTLLWYRLACALPRALPDAATAALAEPDARIAREDYRFVLDRLGPCGARARVGSPA